MTRGKRFNAQIKSQRNPSSLIVVSFTLLALILSLTSCFKEFLISPWAPKVSQASELCPFQTPEEWQNFITRYSENEKWVETCEDSSCDKNFFHFVKESVQDTFEKCSQFISQHPNIAQCTKHLRNFTVAWMQQHSGDSYGFTVDNHTYLSQQESSDQPPGMMKIPDAIIAALPHRSQVEAAARKNGFRYLTHDSALGGYRTFIVIPDPQGRFDQWLLLNLKDKENVIQNKTPLSILTVQKKDLAGNTFSKVKLHFRDYTIAYSGGKYHLELNEEVNGKCYSCHTNGVRQLIARRTPILEAKPVRGEPGYDPKNLLEPSESFAFQRLNEFNQKLRSYGRPDWDGKIIAEHHGPPMGRAQGCTDCHNNISRAALNFSTSTAQIRQKIYYELSMPYDTRLPQLLERKQMNAADFTEDEDNVLNKAFETHSSLVQEYENSRLPTLKKWLLETSCR